MCGIYCALNHHGRVLAPPEALLAKLQSRGPDSLQQHVVHVSSAFCLTFAASVLSLRGDTIVRQPLVDAESGSVLCWNGEAWSIGGTRVEGNDSEAVFRLLLEAARSSRRGILDAFSSIRGPFSCVFYDGRQRGLFFGRDVLGRRSMVKSMTPQGDFVLCSVPHLSADATCAEVEADGMYVVSLSDDADPTAIRCPISHQADGELSGDCIRAPYGTLNSAVPNSTVAALDINSPSVGRLEKLLLGALDLRTAIPGPPSTPLGVLFSGGLDSALLAYLAHKVSPASRPIDLLNVAFQNPRIHGDDVDPYSTCPDRITGLSAYADLQNRCPSRTFRFVAINIPYTETLAHREQIISLMHPHNTEMDLSIASALYFACRGQGHLYDEAQIKREHATRARVLLSGLGADELFAGYSRHAIAHGRRGAAALIDELALDFGRLGRRNLGRDDRVTAHWGREVRYPFLDEALVAWAVAAPVWEKCGFLADGEPRFEPGKLVLRLLASKCGLEKIACEKKRAVSWTFHDGLSLMVADTIRLANRKDARWQDERHRRDSH